MDDQCNKNLMLKVLVGCSDHQLQGAGAYYVTPKQAAQLVNCS